MFNWVFGSVSGLFGKWDSACIDNHVFRLHYRASFIICLAGSLLVTSKQFVGNPINCMSEGVSGGVMDIYCWIHSTFTVPAKLAGTQGVDMPHDGIGPLDGEPVLHHKYYQWVVFVLSLQSTTPWSSPSMPSSPSTPPSSRAGQGMASAATRKWRRAMGVVVSPVGAAAPLCVETQKVVKKNELKPIMRGPPVQAWVLLKDLRPRQNSNEFVALEGLLEEASGGDFADQLTDQLSNQFNDQSAWRKPDQSARLSVNQFAVEVDEREHTRGMGQHDPVHGGSDQLGEGGRLDRRREGAGQVEDVIWKTLATAHMSSLASLQASQKTQHLIEDLDEANQISVLLVVRLSLEPEKAILRVSKSWAGGPRRVTSHTVLFLKKSRILMWLNGMETLIVNLDGIEYRVPVFGRVEWFKNDYSCSLLNSALFETENE